MEIQIENCTTKTIKYKLINSSISFANSLRKILLSEIPTLAIDLVEIKKNCTILPDEMIAHRLGLIPIQFNDTILYKEECSCSDICQSCGIKGTLQVENRTDSIVKVTTMDITLSDCDHSLLNLKHPSVIVKLAYGQSIDLEFVIRKGVASAHSKFCPVTTVGFSYDENNKLGHTDYWFEKDKNKEWGITEEIRDMEECDKIEMEFETVDGMIDSKVALKKGLEIMGTKVGDLLIAMENYEHII